MLEMFNWLVCMEVFRSPCFPIEVVSNFFACGREIFMGERHRAGMNGCEACVFVWGV